MCINCIMCINYTRTFKNKKEKSLHFWWVYTILVGVYVSPCVWLLNRGQVLPTYGGTISNLGEQHWAYHLIRWQADYTNIQSSGNPYVLCIHYFRSFFICKLSANRTTVLFCTSDNC